MGNINFLNNFNEDLRNIEPHLSINHFKEYSELNSLIEIEIIPVKNQSGNFINIPDKEDEIYFHIYFNNNVEEIKRNYLNENENIEKIKIVIDPQIKSFYKLFSECKIVKSINFIKFDRNNIYSMSHMFSGCSSLKELNITNFNTDSVTDMSYMFSKCLLLKDLIITNFNTNNVIIIKRIRFFKF